MKNITKLITSQHSSSFKNGNKAFIYLKLKPYPNYN